MLLLYVLNSLMVFLSIHLDGPQTFSFRSECKQMGDCQSKNEEITRMVRNNTTKIFKKKSFLVLKYINH